MGRAQVFKERPVAAFLGGRLTPTRTRAIDLPMPEYRAYIVDKDGHIKTFEVVTAVDDESAIQAATHMADRYDVEIWHLDRKVAFLPQKI